MPKVEIVKRHKSLRTRQKAVLLRLTEDEFRELGEASEMLLLPLTTWARQVLVQAAAEVKARSKRLRGIVSTDADSTHSVKEVESKRFVDPSQCPLRGTLLPEVVSGPGHAMALPCPECGTIHMRSDAARAVGT